MSVGSSYCYNQLQFGLDSTTTHQKKIFATSVTLFRSSSNLKTKLIFQNSYAPSYNI